MGSDVEHLFRYLLALMCAWENVYLYTLLFLQSDCWGFFWRGGIIVCCWVVRAFQCILELPPYQIHDLQGFSLILSLPFHFVDCFPLLYKSFSVWCSPAETGNVGIRAACPYQNPRAVTRIESSWSLYSDGWWSEKMAGCYPKGPSCISSHTNSFYKEKKSVGKGLGIQGKSNQIKAAVQPFS